MLATRIIPVLLHRGTQLVKGKQFKADRVIGHVLQAAEIYSQRGVDELCVLDIAATPEGRGPDLKLVEKITAKCFSPVTIGGGVRSVQDVRDLLSAGADKVAIKTSVIVAQEAAEIVGAQAVVFALDYRKPANGRLTIPVPRCGEILLTDIDREGMMCGYDLETIRSFSSLPIPVIAHGGCGSPEDMRFAIEAGASAVAAGSLFAFTETTPKDCARYLQQHGVEVRV